MGFSGEPATISLRQQLEQQYRLFVAQMGEADPLLAALPPETVVHGEFPSVRRGVAAQFPKQPATMMIGHQHMPLAPAIPVGRRPLAIAGGKTKCSDLWQSRP